MHLEACVTVRQLRKAWDVFKCPVNKVWREEKNGVFSQSQHHTNAYFWQMKHSILDLCLIRANVEEHWTVSTWWWEQRLSEVALFGWLRHINHVIIDRVTGLSHTRPFLLWLHCARYWAAWAELLLSIIFLQEKHTVDTSLIPFIYFVSRPWIYRETKSCHCQMCSKQMTSLPDCPSLESALAKGSKSLGLGQRCYSYSSVGSQGTRTSVGMAAHEASEWEPSFQHHPDTFLAPLWRKEELEKRLKTDLLWRHLCD